MVIVSEEFIDKVVEVMSERETDNGKPKMTCSLGLCQVKEQWMQFSW